MTEALAIRVARALRRATMARSSTSDGNPGSDIRTDGVDQNPGEEELAFANAAIEACFDDIWSDGYLIGSKYGASGMSAELLRSVAKEQVLSRTRTPEPSAPSSDGGPEANSVARAEAALRHLAERSKNRRS
jgi:hypothetical protein